MKTCHDMKKKLVWTGLTKGQNVKLEFNCNSTRQIFNMGTEQFQTNFSIASELRDYN